MKKEQDQQRVRFYEIGQTAEPVMRGGNHYGSLRPSIRSIASRLSAGAAVFFCKTASAHCGRLLFDVEELLFAPSARVFLQKTRCEFGMSAGSSISTRG